MTAEMKGNPVLNRRRLLSHRGREVAVKLVSVEVLTKGACCDYSLGLPSSLL